MKKTTFLLGMSLLLLQLPVNAGSWWDTGKELLGGVVGGETGNTANNATKTLSGLSVEDISAGLKDALKVGTENVVAQLGKPEGFNLDENIHIPLPAEIEQAKKLLDSVGMGNMLGELETKLNRGAEAATPKAKELFLAAISEMSIEDAKKIYDGPEDSATNYFKEKMSANLADEMRPVIENSLNEVGAVQTYDAIMNQYKTIPFVPDIKANLTEHAVTKGIDGIFYYLAQEEAAIRKDPVKQTTALLKKVFGQ
ncbi:MAG: DUF4197 domain-containing protein [Porticoccus sp.]|nr:DUF4197 domain-containing protein [Porticoccus sp.]